MAAPAFIVDGVRVPLTGDIVVSGAVRAAPLPAGSAAPYHLDFGEAGDGGSTGVPLHAPSHREGGADELALVDLAGDLTAARISDFSSAADVRVAVHAGETDPHPQYLTAAEGAAAYDAAGAATTAVAAHVAAADPHPVYTTAAEVAALLPGYAARATLVLTTSSLAAGATDATLSITAAAGIRIIDVTTDRAARVRIYASAAQRTADASRAAGTLPTGDAGLCYELVTTALVLSHTETVEMNSKDGAAALYVSITNNDAVTHTVQVTITYQRIE